MTGRVGIRRRTAATHMAHQFLAIVRRYCRMRHPCFPSATATMSNPGRHLLTTSDSIEDQNILIDMRWEKSRVERDEPVMIEELDSILLHW